MNEASKKKNQEQNFSGIKRGNNNSHKKPSQVLNEGKGSRDTHNCVWL